MVIKPRVEKEAEKAPTPKAETIKEIKPAVIKQDNVPKGKEETPPEKEAPAAPVIKEIIIEKPSKPETKKVVVEDV